MHRDLDFELAEIPSPQRGRNVVVVVGIDRYQRWPRLENAVSDARGAHKLFVQLGFEEAAPPLLDEMATGEALRQLATDKLAQLAGQDSLIVFFAGHGHTVTNTFEDGQPVKTGYLVPVNGDRTAVASWLRIDSWLSDIARLPPRHILVILDACSSGVALRMVRLRGNRGDAHPAMSVLQSRRSRRVITSAFDDQAAMDSGPVGGHSLFTGCLIEALTSGLPQLGKVLVTGSQIGSYLQERVAAYAESRQTPDFGALELDDRGELVIELPGMSPPDAPQALPAATEHARTRAAAEATQASSEIVIASPRSRALRFSVVLMLVAIAGVLTYSGVRWVRSLVIKSSTFKAPFDEGIAAVDAANTAQSVATSTIPPDGSQAERLTADAAVAVGTHNSGHSASGNPSPVPGVSSSRPAMPGPVLQLKSIEQQLEKHDYLSGSELHNMVEQANVLIGDGIARDDACRVIAKAQCRLQNVEAATMEYRQLNKREQRAVRGYCTTFGIVLEQSTVSNEGAQSSP